MLFYVLFLCTLRGEKVKKSFPCHAFKDDVDGGNPFLLSLVFTIRVVHTRKMMPLILSHVES